MSYFISWVLHSHSFPANPILDDPKKVQTPSKNKISTRHDQIKILSVFLQLNSSKAKKHRENYEFIFFCQSSNFVFVFPVTFFETKKNLTLKYSAWRFVLLLTKKWVQEKQPARKKVRWKTCFFCFIPKIIFVKGWEKRQSIIKWFC